MKQLAKFMSRDKLRYFASGIFYSKLSYCLPVFGNVFGLERFKEESSRYTSYTKNDNNSLQVLKNKLNRLLLNARYDTPTSQLLEETDSLSVQQMIAYQTAVMAYKVLTSKKPEYLADKLKILNVGGSLRKKTGSISLPRYSLSISREGFLYRASTILNLMEEDWSCDPNSEKFKIHAKDWVKANIAIKPFKDSRSMSFSSRKIQNQH